nr:his-3 [Neurospora crassa]prf//1202293A gene his 3 [Neurospora crassa]
METTLPLPFLRRVSVPPGLNDIKEGLSREEVSCLGCVFFEVKPQTLEKILRFLKRHNVEFEPYFDVTALESIDDIITLLDAGARKCLSRPSSWPTSPHMVPRCPHCHWKQRCFAFLRHRERPFALRLRSDCLRGCTVSGGGQRQENYPLLHQARSWGRSRTVHPGRRQRNAIPILPSTGLTTKKDEAGKLAISTILSSVWKSDRPDGLLPTVVVDEHDTALGLVYSSAARVNEALRTQTGVYQSRKRGLWYKGATSGDTQELVRISLDCDNDALKFVVKQKGRFCHLDQSGCFGQLKGLPKLEQTLISRKQSAPEGSYTARLFSDEKLVRAKIMEEAEELCTAQTPQEIAFEAADLFYFALTRAVAAGVTLADIERSLDAKSWKVKRRTGDAKGKWAERRASTLRRRLAATSAPVTKEAAQETTPEKITMRRFDASKVSTEELDAALKRPAQKSPMPSTMIIVPIIEDVRKNGDKAVLSYTHKFEKATSLTSPVLKAPFPKELMQLPEETIAAIDVSFENIRKFHAAQKEEKPLQVETMPGVVCSRFSRPIEAVGCYIPGGTAVLPSTALMLGVPAMVAGCNKIVFASPPRADGTITPEIVYVAHKVGAESIVLAGGAQAVAAMVRPESITKVDKILGPGNQFVTAANMFVSNDTNAAVGIDMPAGPSEVLVIAHKDANPAFVASDLLSRAEHGVDSQVILIAIDLDEEHLQAIEDEVHRQATELPHVQIVRGSIAHSITVQIKTVEEAMELSNKYAPEHLILQIKEAEKAVDLVMNAVVFIGATPSAWHYSAGVNHSLPTYGFAKQYSGVNLASFVKHITSSNLTAEGLKNVGQAVMQLAKVGARGSRRAVSIRLEHMSKSN